MLQKLEVGAPYARVIGRGEGVMFDIQYPNIELIYNVSRPTQKELEEVGMGKQFEIRAAEFNDVIIITAKIGALSWIDAPYNPNLGDCRLDNIESDTEGYGLWFLLTDSPSGIIKHMRLIGLGNRFSMQFRDLVYANKSKNIPVEQYDKKVKEVFAKYTTKELADFSSLRFRIKGEG